MATHFIELTTLSGKISINPALIASVQTLGDAPDDHPKTNIFAGERLFVLETRQEILDACAHVDSQEALAPAQESARRAPKRRPEKLPRPNFSTVEKRNIEATRALEALARSRNAVGDGTIDEAGEGSGPKSG